MLGSATESGSAVSGSLRRKSASLPRQLPARRNQNHAPSDGHHLASTNSSAVKSAVHHAPLASRSNFGNTGPTAEPWLTHFPPARLSRRRRRRRTIETFAVRSDGLSFTTCLNDSNCVERTTKLKNPARRTRSRAPEHAVPRTSVSRHGEVSDAAFGAREQPLDVRAVFENHKTRTDDEIQGDWQVV